MSALAQIIFAVALIGAFALWIYGAVTYVRVLHAIRTSEENAGMTWHAVFNWLSASRHLKGDAAIHAAKINRAVHGLVLCVIVAAAAAIFATIPSQAVQ